MDVHCYVKFLDGAMLDFLRGFKGFEAYLDLAIVILILPVRIFVRHFGC